jgi:uncharacterized protein (DUF2267 family)
MNYQEFVSKVQNYADLDSNDKALKVIEVTLTTLSERISSPHRRHLLSQLPGEFKDFTVKQKRIEYFSVEEFYKRVSARAETTYHEAIKNARALMCVLQEAVARGELEDIFEELTDGWDELLKAKPKLPISRYTVDAHELFRK